MRRNRIHQDRVACQPAMVGVALDRAMHGTGRGTMSVQLLYDDRSAAIHAVRGFEQILKQLELKPEVKFDLWRWDVLCHSELRALAAREIRKANILLIAPGRDKGVPEQVFATVVDWLCSGDERPRALVLFLVAVANNLVSPKLLALEHAAQSSGAQVFLHVSEPAPVRAQDKIEMAAEKGTNFPDEALRSPQQYRHWGLNE